MIRKANNLTQTRDLAKEFLKTLKAGDVIALSGNLGAGKTTFVQMIATELGIKDHITSPTYVFLRTYDLPKKKRSIETLVHIDAYRLTTGQELIDVGAEEFVSAKNTITFIEWPENVPEIIPSSAIRLEITRDGEKRLFTTNKKPPR